MDVQSTFYIFGIIYLTLNIVILLAIVIGIFYIIKTVKDIRNQITQKLKQVDNFIQNPEEILADIGTSFIKSAVRRAKNAFRRKEDEL